MCQRGQRGGLTDNEDARDDRWIAGVCGGLAAATSLEAWAWRLLFAVLRICSGAGLPICALLWIFLPAGQARSAVQDANVRNVSDAARTQGYDDPRDAA